MFIVAIISLFVVGSPFKDSEYWQNAKLSSMAASWANTLSTFIPENFLENINTGVVAPAKSSIEQNATNLRSAAMNAVADKITLSSEEATPNE